MADVAALYAPKWRASTAYTAGQQVISPNGDVVAAIATFTSASTYNPANWTLSTTFAARPTQPEPLAATTRLARPFAGKESVYNAHARNGRRARAGLVNAAVPNNLTRFTCVGDSITRGLSPATVTPAISYPSRLKALLKAKGLTCAGDGFVIPAGYDTAISDAQWVYTGTWDFNYASSGYVFGARANAASSTVTYTTIEPCTTLEIHWFNGIGNAVTVLIDGASPSSNATITPVGGNTIGVAAYTGLANTTHTVKITTTGTAFVLHGINCYSSSGFVVDNFGYSGSSTTDWKPTTWNAPLTLSQRPAQANTTGYNIVILGLGTNNAIRSRTTSNGTDPATYQTDLGNIVTSMLSVAETMLIAPPPSVTYVDPNGMQGYSTAAYALAETLDVRLLDMYDRWTTYTEAFGLGLLSSDGVHPADAGYREYSAAVLSLLGA
jgi:lysophospholipase L1-like esterase